MGPATKRKRAREEEGEEEEEEERCRLCLGGEEDGPLLQLCACRGSARLVHRHCLERWRRTSPNEDEAYCCGECKDRYRDALSLELLSARLQAERARGQVLVVRGVHARLHAADDDMLPRRNLVVRRVGSDGMG